MSLRELPSRLKDYAGEFAERVGSLPTSVDVTRKDGRTGRVVVGRRSMTGEPTVVLVVPMLSTDKTASGEFDLYRAKIITHELGKRRKPKFFRRRGARTDVQKAVQAAVKAIHDAPEGIEPLPLPIPQVSRELTGRNHAPEVKTHRARSHTRR